MKTFAEKIKEYPVSVLDFLIKENENMFIVELAIEEKLLRKS